MISLPFKRAYNCPTGKYYHETNFPVFDFNELENTVKRHREYLLAVLIEALAHEWVHKHFFYEMNGTSFNMVRFASEELMSLESDMCNKNVHVLKLGLKEREDANNILYLSSKPIMEAITTFYCLGCLSVVLSAKVS